LTFNVTSDIDLRADYEIVYANAIGIIIKQGFNAQAGKYMVVDHENGIESIYISFCWLQPKRPDQNY